MAMGMTMVIVAGGIDLSVGSIVGSDGRGRFDVDGRHGWRGSAGNRDRDRRRRGLRTGQWNGDHRD
jgi:hypothetical protein